MQPYCSVFGERQPYHNGFEGSIYLVGENLVIHQAWQFCRLSGKMPKGGTYLARPFYQTRLVIRRKKNVFDTITIWTTHWCVIFFLLERHKYTISLRCMYQYCSCRFNYENANQAINFIYISNLERESHASPPFFVGFSPLSLCPYKGTFAPGFDYEFYLVEL